MKRGGGPFFMRMDFSFLTQSSVEDLENLSMMVHNDCLLRLIRMIFLIKKNNYDTLSDEQLEKESKDLYQEERYLSHCETNFIWKNEDVPDGLLNAIKENEDLQEAIQFEQERRQLQKK